MPIAATKHALPQRRLTCARCGAAFDCGSGGKEGNNNGGCWCMAETFRMPMPRVADADCLCPSCLRAAVASEVIE
jgi:uncharacterized protein